MVSTGWSREESPFHQGEREVQTRMGVRDKIENFGRRVIRDYMPEQHREFYQQLPFLLLGMTDDRGRPWAGIVAGRSGFITSPDARHLRLAAQPPFGSPLRSALQVGTDVGVLGILPESRRRNRLTGRVAALAPDAFEIEILQTFGNCPQYIQKRALEVLPAIDTPAAEQPIHQGDRLDEAAQAIVQNADTLFIASAYTEGSDVPSQGADVSHRGGKPGFVKLESDRAFIFPDFTGNFHFNTVGNLLLNPKAGFLFVDFERRDLLYLTGTVEIIWQGEEVCRFAGAERLIRFRTEEAIRVENSLPLQFTFGEYSPTLEKTGSWGQASAASGQAPSTGPVKVVFSRSRLEAEWTPEKGTLLELAEEAGLTPPFSCRQGVCGTCATRTSCGTVNYAEEPTATPAANEVLICCSTPCAAAGEETCGDRIGVVLDL